MGREQFWRGGRRWWIGISLVILALAVVAAHVVVPDGAFGDWSYLVVVAGAAPVAWLGVRRHRATVAVLIAVGVSLSASGDVIFQLYAWARGVGPDLSVADIGWLGSYAAIVAALLMLLRRGVGRLDVDGIVDVVAITVVALVVQWEWTLQDLVSDSSLPVLTRFVWALYPAFDAVLLALVLRAVVSRRLQGPAAMLVAGGAACWLLSDFGFTLPAAEGELSAWLDAGWMLGALLLAAVTWVPARPAPSPAEEERAAPGYGSMAITLLPLLVPVLIEIVGTRRGADPNPVVLFVATVLLVGVAFVRGVRSLRAEADARAQLRSRERYAHSIAMNASDAVLVLDGEGRVLSDSPLTATLLGYPGSTIRGLDAFAAVAPVDVNEVRATFARCLSTPGETHETELRVMHADGTERWFDIRLVNMVDDPDVGGVVVNLHEVTDRKRAELELAHQALHDSLTGLANRALFTDRVQQALRRDARTGLAPAVVYLDLDGFKKVNDGLGHAFGDALLCEIAHRLAREVRDGDTVARLGGDEFAMLIEQTRDPCAEAESVAARVLRSLQAPVTLGDQAVTISASVGIAAAGIEDSSSSLLRDADVAMYRAKAAGKGRWVVYNRSMRTAAAERLQLDADLVGALDRCELRVVYQPVVDLDSEQIVGFEALLRWQHPTLGPVDPDKFIPVAEESGLIVPIGRWVLQEACRMAARWRIEHPGDPTLAMAVNVSGRQLAFGDVVATVAEALEVSGLDPSELILEITETTLVQDARVAAGRLRELSNLGVRIAVDDFGTGYSSLSYLREFPVDILKIDQSFVRTITDVGDLPPIVKGLLDLGRTLDLDVIAEGVEFEVQRDGLRTEPGIMAQGYLFARPLEPVDAGILLLETRAPASLPGGS